MQTSKICKKNHNSCPVFPIRTRKSPFPAFVSGEDKSWHANRSRQDSTQAFEQLQTPYTVLHQVQKIGSISGTSATFWKDLFATPFFSLEEVMEPYYDLAEEFYQEVNVLKQVVNAFLQSLQ